MTLQKIPVLIELDCLFGIKNLNFELSSTFGGFKIRDNIISSRDHRSATWMQR